MCIGKIVNKSAIFNAYMYHEINNDKTQEYINACYDASCTLSSLSQISIDLAKKSFIGADGKPISLTKIMNNLNKISYKFKTIENDEEVEMSKKILRYEFDYDNLDEVELEKVIKDEIQFRKFKSYEKNYIPIEKITDKLINEYNKDVEIYKALTKEEKKTNTMKEKYSIKVKANVKKMIVPYFFTKIAKDNSCRIPTYMDCSMDYLQDILKDFKIKAMGTDKKDISDFLIKQKECDGGDWNRNKLDYVREVIDECNSILNQNYYCANDNKEEKKKKVNIRRWAKQEAVQKIIDVKLNPKTIYRIILRAFDKDEKYKGRILYKYRLDEDGNKTDEIITYEKEDIIHKCRIEEFKKMTKLTLDLLYKAYGNEFLKMFKKGKSDNIQVKKYWK